MGKRPQLPAPDKIVPIIGPNCPEGSSDNLRMVQDMAELGQDKLCVTQRFPFPVVATDAAKDAYSAVLRDAGATKPRRDAVDARIVKDVGAGTGKVINSQDEVGGWPRYESGIPSPDSDHDGMPDEWERQHGFDPEDATDGAGDRDGDGYTNVEECLNETRL